MSKPILISGIQPSGRLHLGNYLGALKNFVDLQNSGKYQCMFFIADYHSMTEDFDPKEKSKQIMNLAMDYLASGLDPKKSTIFLQSIVHHSPELSWILESIAPFGELRRMTQFKEKSERQKENASVGLFTYPLLMSADVILYDAKFVPVGDDQLQHLELTRAMARKANGKFGKIFVEPQPLLSKTPRLMSLDDPTKKMSKSMPNGCLFIDDAPAVIEKKIMRAVTDSGGEVKYDTQNKAAVSNLLMIYSELSGKSIKDLEKKFAGKGYADFKKSLAVVVIDYFEPFRKKKASLKPVAVRKIIEDGSKKTHELAKVKIKAIKKKIGLTI